MTAGWENWAGTVRDTPATRLAPASVEALAEALRTTTGPVRVMGSSHSWSGAGRHDRGYTLATLDAPAFRGLDGPVDADGRVWVRAGTTLSQLHGLLAAERRTLANVGSVSAQTMGGIVSTGTHGAGSCFPSLSALVSGVRVVTADGAVRELTAEADGDALPHWQLSLGLLGVIVALRLATVPLFYVAARKRVVPIDEAPDVLAALVADEERTGLRHRFTWFPYAARAEVLSFEAVPPPDVLPDPFEVPSLRDRLEGKLLAEGLFGRGLLRLSRAFPGAVPGVCRFAAAVRFGDAPEPRVGRLYERINEHGVPRHFETEWAVDLRDAPAAWRALRQAIESRGLPTDFLQELRPAKADGATLSAARGRDVCWVSLYQTTPHRWEESLGVAEDVLGGLGGRPHWGKSFDPGRVRARVGPPFAAFEAYRRGVDPAGRFLGPWHRACGFGA